MEPEPEPVVEVTVPTPPPVPQTITLNDILSDVALLASKEIADKATLESIQTVSFEMLRTALVRWAGLGFPNAYSVYEIAISPPTTCSDGVSRSLSDYIVFCSGKTIHDHVAILQQRLPDITVSFLYTGSSIQIVVSRA